MSDDYTAKTSTTGTVAVGGSATGVIEKRGDADWFAVELIAGRTYVIDLEGVGAGTGTLSDAMLYGLFDDAGGRVARRDRDSGEGNDARIVFTATESGTYYIAARGQRKDDTGTYTVQARDRDAETQQTPPVDTNTPQTPEQTSGLLQQQTPPVDTDATAAGATDLGDLAGLGRSGSTRKDSVDGGADGTDYYRFTLSERQEVTLSLQRQDANADLYLEDGDGTVLASSTRGGTRKDSVTSTLEAGTYYVRVAAQEAGDNDYTLRTRAADPAPQPDPGTQNLRQEFFDEDEVERGKTDDYSSDTSTTGAVEVGGSVKGEISYDGDTDWFAVTLEAGTTYEIARTGRAEAFYSGTSPTKDGTVGNSHIRGSVYDDEGNLIPGTQFTGKFFWPSQKGDRTTFTADEDGTYYVSVSAAECELGSYTLSVEEADAM